VIFGAATNLDKTAAHKILNSPTDGDATDPESRDKAVFGGQLVADLQVAIGNLASEDCWGRGLFLRLSGVEATLQLSCLVALVLLVSGNLAAQNAQKSRHAEYPC